jgi:hypothetical protein
MRRSFPYANIIRNLREALLGICKILLTKVKYDITISVMICKFVSWRGYEQKKWVLHVIAFFVEI